MAEVNKSIRRAQKQRGEACTGYVDKRKALVVPPLELLTTPHGEFLVEPDGEKSSASSARIPNPRHAAARQGSLVGSRKLSMDGAEIDQPVLQIQSLVDEDDAFQVKAAQTTPARKSAEIFGPVKHSVITDTKISLGHEPQSNEYELRVRGPKNDESRAFESVEDSKESEPSV